MSRLFPRPHCLPQVYFYGSYLDHVKEVVSYYTAPSLAAFINKGRGEGGLKLDFLHTRHDTNGVGFAADLHGAAQ
jgi:hypothetical protein